MGAIAACFAVFDFTVLSLRFSTVASLCITAGANLSYVILVIVSVLMHWTLSQVLVLHTFPERLLFSFFFRHGNCLLQ